MSTSFRPRPRTLLPFIILLGIYSQGNTSSLRAAKIGNFKIIEVLGFERFEMFLDKTRGTPYERTFHLDDTDPLSPHELVKFIEVWTARIRGLTEPHHRDSLLIFYASEKARPFYTVRYSGNSSHPIWSRAAKEFCEKWAIASVELGKIRKAGLDIVREVNGDDIRAQMAAGGQSAEATLRMHYEGAAAARRHSEALAPAMASLDRWAQTSGRSDGRTEAEDSDLLCATPGWECVDPYSSPIRGQRPGGLCTAFGLCPLCPMGSTDISSAYGCARALQLRQEVENSRQYLDFSRWNAAIRPIGEVLDRKWLPAYPANVLYVASHLNLGPIGVLE